MPELRMFKSSSGLQLTRLAMLACALGYSSARAAPSPQTVPYTAQAPLIDGNNSDDAIWQQATWQAMPYLMAGTEPSAADFTGRYRLLWDDHYLYVQAQLSDDVLWDSRPNPLEAYWDDDALELFVDSDGSGGDHLSNHSAFAYHVALDNQAVDIGNDGKPHLYNSHVNSAWQRQTQAPHQIIWEVAIKLYPNNYSDAKPLPALTLHANQQLGFMLAYCDNDGSDVARGTPPSQSVREHFKGSHDITPVQGDKNQGYKNASVFGRFVLVK